MWFYYLIIISNKKKALRLISADCVHCYRVQALTSKCSFECCCMFLKYSVNGLTSTDTSSSHVFGLAVFLANANARLASPTPESKDKMWWKNTAFFTGKKRRFLQNLHKQVNHPLDTLKLVPDSCPILQRQNHLHSKVRGSSSRPQAAQTRNQTKQNKTGWNRMGPDKTGWNWMKLDDGETRRQNQTPNPEDKTRRNAKFCPLYICINWQRKNFTFWFGFTRRFWWVQSTDDICFIFLLDHWWPDVIAAWVRPTSCTGRIWRIPVP